MALSPRHLQKLGKVKGKIGKAFRETFHEFLFAELWGVDQAIRADVAALSQVFGRELPDAARVVVRQRLLYLVADAPWVRGGQRVGGSWNSAQFAKALRQVGGGARCDFTDAQVTTLNGFVEHYAAQLIDDVLAPAYDEWLDDVAGSTLKEIGAPRDEFRSVRSTINKQLQGEMYQMLVKRRPIQVERSPEKVLKKPY